MLKRAFDLVAAGLGLLVLWPVLVVLAIAIRRDSPGAALFLQERVGRNEKPFICVKLRTMAAGSPNVGSHDAAQAWITPLGRKLRASKLDELPQLLNVLKGEMSLVGPRPCLPVQAEVIAARRAENVFSARPGITGRAQLKGIDMSTPAALAQADADYIRTMSFAGDLRILIATALGKGAGDAAAK